MARRSASTQGASGGAIGDRRRAPSHTVKGQWAKEGAVPRGMVKLGVTDTRVKCAAKDQNTR